MSPEQIKLITATSEQERVEALLKIVKDQWSQEHFRADRLQAEVDRMKPVVEAALALVRARNEQHGNASNPEWWQGHDWPLVVAVGTYEQELKK